MAETVETTCESLTVSRVLKAPAKRVFEAWTDADYLKSWFGPEGIEVTETAIDLNVGGRYDLHMRTSDGDEIHHYGHYKVIEPPSRLVFTWVLDGQACGGSKDAFVETEVAIDIVEVDGGVELTLTHTGLPTQDTRDGHRMGWEMCLESLRRGLTTENAEDTERVVLEAVPGGDQAVLGPEDCGRQSQRKTTLRYVTCGHYSG